MTTNISKHQEQNDNIDNRRDLLESILKNYFIFDHIFNLRDYKLSLETLYEDLLPYCKDVYEDNYRFIFLHYDTDYHITKDQPGIILRNLQRIIADLNISNYFCMIISQKDLQGHLDNLSQQETTDNCSIFCLQHPLQESTHFEKIDVKLNEHAIEHKFMCLNKVKRSHRNILYALLKNKKLLNKGAVSYGSIL
jgi:hypothetical protein